MNRVTAKLLFFCILILFSSQTVLAEDAVVSATIVSNITTVNPPILVAPNDNSATNNPREPLVWKRPLIITNPLHHYDVYVDGALFAATVSDSIVNQNYYYYNIHRENDTFFLNLNTDLAQGYHTWSVTLHDSLDNTASSETRTFYIDSITPFITLTKVDRQTLNWTTKDSTTIPDVNQRDLSVTTPNPLLTGSVEPYANMQFILLCPQNILHCTNQTYQGNYPTGDWQHRFYGLIKGLVYTVYLSATDAAGNSVIFPEFYLAYGVVTPTPSAIITPVPTTPPGISPTLTPEPTPEIVTPPTPFTPVPPAIPTPPIFQTATLAKTPNYLSYFLFLLVIGLPLHLAMTIYGAKIAFSNRFRFLFTLFFPFVGRKNNQTLPFCTIDIYHPDILDKSFQTIISNINGHFSINENLPDKIFIKITCTDRVWKNIIIPGSILSTICLFPSPQDLQTSPDRHRRYAMTFRSLPLIIACLTSSICLYLSPNYFFLIYLYLSLHLVFTEYLYHRFTR
jgi:hypothetical protein